MSLEGNNYEPVDKTEKQSKDTDNKIYKLDFKKDNLRKAEEEQSQQADSQDLDDLLNQLNDMDSQKIGIAIVDQEGKTDKLQAWIGETTPAEESNGDVDENGQATGTGETTVDDGAGWDSK